MFKRLLIVGMAVLAVVILLWMWMSDRPEKAEVSKVAAPAKTAAVSTGTGVKTNQPSALPAMSKPETPPAAENLIENYLTKYGRDARRLLQAFRASKNKDYLKEALARYPDDPMVLFHCVLYDAEPTKERKALLERLQKLLPDDAVPCYLLGEQLLQEGDREGALKLLFEAGLKPTANNYVSERVSDGQEFLVFSGFSPDDALGVSSVNVEMRLMTPMRNLMNMVQDIYMNIAATEDRDKSARTWALAGVSLAQNMQGQMSHTLLENLFSMGMEERFLSRLPQETELEDRGMTVAQRTREIAEFRTLVSSLMLTCDDGFDLPPEERMFFFTRLQEEGELSALLWLNGLSSH